MIKNFTPHSNNQFTEENVNDFPSTLFVTDANGNILISNEFTALTVGMSLEELLKCNVADLVAAGYYDRSITLEAIRKKQRVSRTVNTKRGFSTSSTATPILSKDGNVQLVVTKSNDYREKMSLVTKEEDKIVKKKGKEEEYAALSEQENEIVAESLAMKQIIKVCNQIASYDSKVLIYGESGTGKEVIAKYIHRKSDRAQGPFVTINCAAIPPSLFEYELFGYEKGVLNAGAAEAKKGMMEVANDGILFLDEISEMPLEMQAKLLHVIEKNEVRRVGGIRNIPINCRIITATNRDLWKMVKQGLFREDLYYRVNVIPIDIPPLRERKLDIVGLISSFVKEFNKKYKKQFKISAAEFQQLLSHNWAGNVRELRNYIERMVITEQVNMAKQSEEQITDWFAIDYFIKSNLEQLSTLKDFTAVVEGRFIQQVLTSCDGNATEAANQLGVHRSVIYRKLKKMEEVLEAE